MRWNNYTIVATHSDFRQTRVTKVRAVGPKHAVTLAQRKYPEAKGYTSWESEQCRCSEINNDMCSACYLWWWNHEPEVQRAEDKMKDEAFGHKLAEDWS